MYSYTRTDILGNNSRRFVDMTTKRSSAGSVVDSVWAYSISGAVVTFSNCVYMRGPITATTTPAAYTVTGSDGNVFISVKINTETGTSELIEGSTLAAATDQAVPADEFIKVPLLKLTKKTTGEGEDASVSLSVALDMRRMMCLMLYV